MKRKYPGFNWIARDHEGLHAFVDRPERYYCIGSWVWLSNNPDCAVKSRMLNWITEGDEPVRIQRIFHGEDYA